MSRKDSFDNLDEFEFLRILEYPSENMSFSFPNPCKNVFPLNKLSINKTEQFGIYSKSSDTEPIEKDKLNSKESNRNKKRRGRKILGDSKKVRKNHDRTCSCNIRTKITIAYFSFLIKFINFIIGVVLYREENINQYKLKKITHEKNINIEFIKKLKNKTIEQILSNDICSNKKRNNNINKKICKKIIEKNNFFKNILSKNFMEFYENIFIMSKKEVDLSNYGLNRTIFLNSEVILFEDFKNKIKKEGNGNENDLNSYLSKIDKCANNYLNI